MDSEELGLRGGGVYCTERLPAGGNAFLGWRMEVAEVWRRLDVPCSRRICRDAGQDWGQEEKGTTEGEMARWHH